MKALDRNRPDCPEQRLAPAASISAVSLWLLQEAAYANRKGFGKVAEPVKKTCRFFATWQVCQQFDRQINPHRYLAGEKSQEKLDSPAPAM
ncbi:hypothetical protein [Methylosarcina fibrata]|uniref:hypothetical protein n=1 Tax=Methylosarcina fibrata TaxID=105972 RepID=UPI0012F8932B|nr:hypothetical protein [Methylosarcina fibrata]